MEGGVASDCERREIGGLPAYVVDRPGPVAAALVFRAGQADEPLARRGLTHLVEHLVLTAKGRFEPASGYVDLLSTVLAVEGPPAEVSRRLREIAGMLASPPVERLDIERRVLAVEAGMEGSPREGVLLPLIYGARGPGVAAFAELGLRDVRAGDVVEHAKTWFCHGNAALVVVGRVDGLEDLGLPPGPRRPAAAPLLRTHQVLPAEVPQPGSPLALGAPLPGSPAVAVLSEVLERRAWIALRHDRGLAYHVDCRAKRVGPEERLLMLTTDVEERDASAAAEALVHEVRRLARGELDDHELDDAISSLAEHVDRAEPATLLAASALGELLSGSSRLPAEILAELRTVTVEGVVRAADALSESMLLACPSGTSSGSLPAVDPSHGPAVTGRRHRRRRVSRHLDPFDVIVGGEGVSAVIDDERVITVRYAACVAAIRELDGGLTLVEESGNAVTVDPGDIQDGRDAVARIERALDPRVVVALDERERRVEEGASRPLRPFIVGEASELLAPLLGRDERVMHAAEASRGVRSGVLAVTDRRLLFVAKVLSQFIEEIPLADVERAITKHNPLWPALMVVHRKGRARFGFLTIPRAREAARAIEKALERLATEERRRPER